MGFIGRNKKILEKKLENNIKEAWQEGDKLRCYNLLKLMIKVNKDNKVLLKYIDKFDDKKLRKYYIKWAKQHDNYGFGLKKLFLSPKLYIYLIALYLLGKIK